MIFQQVYIFLTKIDYLWFYKQKFQNYVDSKYIYTKLSNEDKKGFLVQIAYKLGIKIEIYDI